MNAIKWFVIGMGFLMLLLLGSCAIISASTAMVVNSAVDAAGRGIDKVDDRLQTYHDDAEMDRWNREDVTRNKTTHFENHHPY